MIRTGVRLGLCGGLLFAVSMLGEYQVPHDERAGMWIGLATFGLFFLLLFTAGLMARLARARLRSAPLAAVWAAVIASECWFILLLAIYYTFLDSPQEARFLEVDRPSPTSRQRQDRPARVHLRRLHGRRLFPLTAGPTSRRARRLPGRAGGESGAEMAAGWARGELARAFVFVVTSCLHQSEWDRDRRSVVQSVPQVNFDSLRLAGDVDDQCGGLRIGELLGKRKLWLRWG